MGLRVAKKRILFVLTAGGRRTVILIMCVILVSMLINTAVFTVFNNKLPLEGLNIAIDPGHGGIDGGAGQEFGVLEKDINLEIAFQLKKQLVKNKALVYMTRESDISLDDRNSYSSSRHVRDLLARVDQFNSGKFDFFISVHVNSSPKKSSLGPIVLYSKRIPESSLLALNIQETLNKRIEPYSGERAVHRPIASDFFILENSNIPGVIVETGFITNNSERALLQREDYQTVIAEAVTEGIRNYLKEIRKIRKQNKKLLYK